MKVKFGLASKKYLEKVWQGELPHYPIFGKDPVRMSCRWYRALPQDYFINRQRERGLKDKYTEGCLISDCMTPDTDNLQKFVMDALEGIMYEDDKQVVSIDSSKWMDTKKPYLGRTCVRVEFQYLGEERTVATQARAQRLRAFTH